MSDSVNVTVPHVVVSRERLNDILCNALEGGITYWCSRIAIDDYRGREWAHEAIAKGTKFTVYPHDDEPVEVEDFAYNKLPRALGKLATEYPYQWALFMDEQDDAETADILFQLYVFGELVYG